MVVTVVKPSRSQGMAQIAAKPAPRVGMQLHMGDEVENQIMCLPFHRMTASEITLSLFWIG